MMNVIENRHECKWDTVESTLIGNVLMESERETQKKSKAGRTNGHQIRKPEAIKESKDRGIFAQLQVGGLPEFKWRYT